MSTTNGVMREVQRAGRQGKGAAGQALRSEWVDRLLRLGFAVRGILYATIGVLAIQVAMGKGNQTADQQGAIATLGQQPNGHVVLWIMLIGLIGYSMWGVIRAVFDPLHRGHDMKGLVQRAGYLFSAFGYALLILPTAGFLQGTKAPGNGQGPQTWSAQLLSGPGGQWLLGLVGLIGLAGGLWQVYYGWTERFRRELKTYGMSGEQYKWALRLGRFGYAARGIAFALIGLFLVRAALTANAGEARGLDGALAALATQPYGTPVLAIVALGLIAFGGYSIMGAWWFRTQQG